VIVFDLGASGQRLILEVPVLQHLEAHRQLTVRHREAGGQLFAAFSDDSIVIKEATGPRRSDHRTKRERPTDLIERPSKQRFSSIIAVDCTTLVIGTRTRPHGPHPRILTTAAFRLRLESPTISSTVSCSSSLEHSEPRKDSTSP
jgi:hypothetical protein